MMETGYFWMDDIKECFSQPTIKPNRITGEGRMRIRGKDKAPAIDKRKWKGRTKTTKQSRRKNRRKNKGGQNGSH